jgi:hypothetical protein
VKLHDTNSYAVAISAAWTQSVDSILDAASLCAEADERLSSVEKAALLAQLRFSESKFSKLVKIGNDPRLREEEVRRLLPASYSIMYEFALLSDEQQRSAIVDGVLHDEAKRSEVEACRVAPDRVVRAKLPLFDEVVEKAVPAKKKKEAGICFAELRMPSDFPAEAREQLERDLLRVAESHGVELVRHLTREERWEAQYLKRMNAFARRWEQIGLQLTRQRVKELQRACKKRNEKWGFFWDETDLDHMASWPDIERVLGVLAIPDEYEGIRDRAEHLANMPDIDPPPGYEQAPISLPPQRKPRQITSDKFSDWK